MGFVCIGLQSPVFVFFFFGSRPVLRPGKTGLTSLGFGLAKYGAKDWTGPDFQPLALFSLLWVTSIYLYSRMDVFVMSIIQLPHIKETAFSMFRTIFIFIFGVGMGRPSEFKIDKQGIA
jgi:hypothetical protein